MFAAKSKDHSVARRRLQDDALLSKLMTRIVQECRRSGVEASAPLMDEAQAILKSRLARGSLSDRDLRSIVRQISGCRAESATPDPTYDAQLHEVAPASKQQPKQTRADEAPTAAHPIAASPAPSSIPSELLLNTTKRQRQLLADAEWIKQAEEDRVQGAMKRKNEREHRTERQRAQRNALNEQLSEHERQKRAAAEARRKAQDDMTQAIRDAQEEARRERQEAMMKAEREKEFRERQANEMERAREEQRIQEHNDQVRHMMMTQQEIQRQRDEEAAAKLREKEEWKQVLSANEQRLLDKARKKDAERAEDRRFQKEYEDNLDRQERERAEAKARKEARAATFQQMANVVATMHAKKVQNVDDKIEAEFQEQQQRSLEDERQRRLRAKQRIAETHEVLKEQQHMKDLEKQREKEDAKRLAQAMKEQADEAARQERARKAAAKAEAARMKDFLTTQLQLQHFRETRPPQTSIARPESRGKTMYSPSRYTPSPTLIA
jgi:hypothetical protein